MNFAQEAVNDRWRLLLTRLRIADDFQARQFVVLTETSLKNKGVSLDAVS
jgi:hypothetical protein